MEILTLLTPFVFSLTLQDQARWLQKRKQTNDERRAAGDDPLPDEESALDKKVREPRPPNNAAMRMEELKEGKGMFVFFLAVLRSS